MPDFYKLTGDIVLVLSDKKDACNVTTPNKCSCSAAAYNREPCRHQHKYFIEPKTISRQTMADTLQEAKSNLLIGHVAGCTCLYYMT